MSWNNEYRVVCDPGQFFLCKKRYILGQYFVLGLPLQHSVITPRLLITPSATHQLHTLRDVLVTGLYLPGQPIMP